MDNTVTQRFIEQTAKDAETFREAAEAWEELKKQGARLEDLNGEVVATATEMVQYYRNRERELRQIIERVRQH